MPPRGSLNHHVATYERCHLRKMTISWEDDPTSRSLACPSRSRHRTRMGQNVRIFMHPRFLTLRRGVAGTAADIGRRPERPSARFCHHKKEVVDLKNGPSTRMYSDAMFDDKRIQSATRMTFPDVYKHKGAIRAGHLYLLTRHVSS